MKLKNHYRAPVRLALAGLLAALSCSSFAQSPLPGTVASAQAKSQGSNAAPRPAVPAAKGQSAFAPAPQPSTYPGGPGTAAVSLQAEGRLKPRVVRPADEGEGGAGLDGPAAYPGSSYVMPGPGPRPSRSPQAHNFGYPRGMPAPGAPSPHSASNNPFSPPGAMPPPAPSLQHGVPPSAQPALPKKKKEADSAEEVPAINLLCTTPDIKEQGVFIGKIQNRYVYKYKSQYCFDVTP